jgi:LmbE family N-acetylglucosaminyl deacetylase
MTGDMNQIDLKDLGKSVVVISPHDDDGIIGCGGIMHDLSLIGARTSVLIMTDGSLGYSSVKQKSTIKKTRRKEAESAYKILGAEPFFLDFPDMNLSSFACWETFDGKNGAYKRVLKILRKVRPETVFAPNSSDWHPDHKAAFDIGLSISNLAAIPAVADFGEPIDLNHLFSYRVWDDLVRVTHMHKLSQEARKTKRKSISEFKSQGDILDRLILQFEEELLQRLK